MAETMNRQQRLVVTIAVLASFVAFLDGSIVNVALPAIGRELGGGLTTQQWTVDAYLITLGSLILLAGSVSDAFGRILVMRIGLIGFGVASVAIALAPDPLLLIVARAVQGAAGAFLVPSSLALITSSMRGPLQAHAIGVWTALTTAATIAGPLVGGLFVDYLSWRFAFVINVVPIAVTLWLLPRLELRDTRREDAGIDWIGAALCTLGLGGMVFALIEQPNLGWASPAIWMPLAVGVTLFAAFLWRQRTARHPILPLGLFGVRNFWTGNVATAFIYGALALNGFVVGVYLQQGAGLSATLAGLASIPTTVLLVLLSSRMGALAGRLGPRLFMTVGPFLMAAGSLLLLTVSEDFDYWWQVLPSMIVFGLGLAVTVSPLTAAILGAIEPARSGIASAVNNAVSRVAGLIVIATLAAIVGGSLDLAGFHRAAVATAVLMAAGGVVSFLGIRTPRPATTAEDDPAATSP
ncbi:MFS transporter [Microbacterium sp. zg.Y1090]|uniref:MFS transporter n=1 Tax=Microbacterium TaxID=33882 RepID=UPI00214B5A52|nr:MULTISPECIES: MFS transporter [unclassified Microbacterium]MCR2813883.1 MFS transporter [Microbacterium sp. zg.Y1084]MCR2819607.1 MFS transporter [Microbacterium sp. zg.Y1090]MDL5487072.1 MFS transporter [Microbacterium sp. zg-Y1211]WIM28147.1 MFS transporter [Microbacterium sp. zg-Y1090]